MPVSAKDAVEPQEPLQTSRARLNPFAFPSETQLRVVLLSVTLLSLAWSTGFLFTSAIVAPRLGLPPLLSLQLPNLDIWEINKGHSPLPLPNEVAEHERRLSERLERMTDPAEVAKSRDSLRQLAEACRGTLRILSAYLVIPTLFTLILAVVIFFLYLTHPARVRRSRGLAELKPDDKSEFQAAVRALLEEARQVQLSEEGRAPRFPRLAFGRGTQGDAQAFGLPWRPWIALTRAVPTIFRKDLLGHGRPYRMRALVLHELAHFANGDVARSFWAESTWIVLAPLLFLQVLSLVLLARTPGNSTLGVPLVAPIFQTVLSLLLAELVRRSILRDREFYADLRVALTWKTERSLQESLMPQLAVAPLSDSFPFRPDSRVERLKLWFQRLWAKHPAPEERWLIIQNPSRLFRVTSDLPLASGLLLGQLSFLVVWASSLLIMMAASLGILRTISTTLRLLREQGAVTALEYHYRFGSFLGVALILIGGLTLLLGGRTC